MPINRGYMTVDGITQGYYQWGDSGKKYPYTIGDVSSREIARSKAVKQAQAAYSAGYRKK